MCIILFDSKWNQSLNLEKKFKNDGPGGVCLTEKGDWQRADFNFWIKMEYGDCIGKKQSKGSWHHGKLFLETMNFC